MAKNVFLQIVRVKIVQFLFEKEEEVAATEHPNAKYLGEDSECRYSHRKYSMKCVLRIFKGVFLLGT